ncbi:MAG: dolichyl-phosphate-mannose--protein mannosyltransferase [Actinomycetota bacterium]
MLAVGAVTLLAGAVRFHALSRPPEKVFDETYYASDGCWYAGEPYKECDLEDDVERSWVHPPLGKQIIALGIDAFGNRSFGWRFTAALAGTAMVALVGILAFLLFGSALWAGVASLLAGTEHLLFVQSRIAMLDIFLALFVVAGFVLLVADRKRADRAVQPAHAEGSPRPRRPLRYLSGAAFGAAIAVKWSGVLALLAAVILALAWERSRRKATGRERPFGLAIREEGIWIYVAFVIVPLLVYALPWIPWLADRGFDMGEFVRHHGQMAEYHFGLDTLKESGEPIHPYMSRAAGWLLLLRPVSYHWQGDPDCCAEILGIGNPALFWGALLFIPYLVLVWVSRKEWQAGAILVPIVVQLLPWLVVARPLFLFYMTPISPFLALGMVYPLRDLLRSGLDRRVAFAAATVVVGVCVALFAFFWPVLAASPLTYEEWRSRIWFDGWV